MIMSQSIERDIPLRTNNQNITTNASNSYTTMSLRDTSSDPIAKTDTNINSTLSLDGHCDGERGSPSLCEGAPPQFTLGTATSTAVNTPSTTLETNATTNVTATTSAKFCKAKSAQLPSSTNRANYKRLPLQSNREYTTVTTDEEVECGSSSSSSDSDDIEDGEEVDERSEELDFSEDDLSQEEEGGIEGDEGVEPSHDCHAAALERHRRYMYFQDSDSSSDEEDNTDNVDTDDDDDSQEDLSEEEMISSDEEESDVEPLEEDDEQELESDDDEESIDASCYYDQQQHLEEEEEEDFYTDYDQYHYNDDDELMENYHGTPPHQHPHFSSNSFQLHDLYLPRGMETEYELLKYDSDEDSSCSSSNEDEESGEYVGVNQAFPHRRYMIQRGGGYGYRPRMWDGSSSSSSSSALSRQRQSNAVVERTISPSTINSSDDDEEETDQVTTSSTTTTKTSVTFNTKVTIHPIYETKPPIYPPQILDKIYTNRDELRLNKLRNKKEYAYDNHDWRMCTEEEGMEVDLITGECVHPVHGESESSSGSGSIVGSGSRVPIVQTYSSAWGGYHHSSCNDDDEDDEEEEENTASNLSCSSSNRVIVHRAKRMRMYYP